MGTNKHYDVYTAKLAAEEKEWDRRQQPVSIPDGIVRATGRRKDEPQPVPVQALVPVPVPAPVPVHVTYSDVVEVTGEVIASTPGGAVLVRFIPADQRSSVHVWLWANAVRRI